jgi:hypothetical protein
MPEQAASPTFPFPRWAAIGLAWLALFSLFYTVGNEVSAWPKLHLGELRDLDLVVGFLSGMAVLFALLARRAPAEN